VSEQNNSKMVTIL